jgi:hypothetical protein
VISSPFSVNPAGHVGHHFDNELPWVPPQLEPSLLSGIPALQSYRTLSNVDLLHLLPSQLVAEVGHHVNHKLSWVPSQLELDEQLLLPTSTLHPGF